jgi:hypothetical protein
MAVHYFCRHCGYKVGSIDNKSVDIQNLGFNSLEQEERMDMIQYHNNGDVHVKTICEDCHEALERNPGLHELNSIIQ